jgi:hypothetical protein
MQPAHEEYADFVADPSRAGPRIQSGKSRCCCPGIYNDVYVAGDDDFATSNVLTL